MPPRHVYKIVFASQGKVYEIYARKVEQGRLFGFIEVEELVFGERSQILVDTTEERIKNEFDGVKRTWLPIHAILRIDEVRKEGISKVFAAEDSKVTPFPLPVYTLGRDPAKGTD